MVKDIRIRIFYHIKFKRLDTDIKLANATVRENSGIFKALPNPAVPQRQS